VQRYLDSVEPGHRERFGQFFTPPVLAEFMCRWVLEGGAPVLFDPAFGLGAFFLAAKGLSPRARFVGLERDEKILKHVQGDNAALDLEQLSLTLGDYFASWGEKRTAIVCNPPYMRFQHFLERGRVIPELEKHTGLKLSGYTNTASAFLLKSLVELGAGGRLAYLMPLEFLNTGYGEVVKRALLHRARLKALLKVEPEGEVFPDAITSVGIVLACDDGDEGPVRFCTITDLEQLKGSWEDLPGRTLRRGELHAEEKWTRHFEALASTGTSWTSSSRTTSTGRWRRRPSGSSRSRTRP
jgi:adenine-specific DNA-methyltransferase